MAIVTASKDRNQILVQAARAYYEEGRTQEEIAQALQVSRSQVSHYLREARDLGIVQIRVVEPTERAADIEIQLGRRFPHLKYLRVLPLFGRDSEVVRRVVGRAAAGVLEDLVRPGHRVCIGCGRTLREMVRSLRPSPQENVALVQAMGSIGHEALDIDFAELAREAARAFGARVFVIPAPAILGAGTARELIEGNPTIARAMELARSADVYVVGLGSLESDLIYSRAGLVSAPEFAHLQAIGVVGDICGRFFDSNGKPLRSKFEERVVGIELEDLRRASVAIGVAGGGEKIAPLLGVLRGGYLNGIVTDEQTALGMLRLDEGGKIATERQEGEESTRLSRKEVMSS